MAKSDILPIFIPQGGCRHRCVFCDQRRISGRDHLPTPEELTTLIPPDFPSGGTLAFYGGSFTALPLERLNAYLTFAAAQKKAGRIGAIRLSTHPAHLDGEMIARLVAYGVDCVELGVQSLDDGVLAAAGRGHDAKDALAAMERLAASTLSWGVQLMIGLPGDNPKKDFATVLKVLDYAPDLARVYPLLVLEGTPLAELWRQGAYAPLSLDAAVTLSAALAALFKSARIPVVRMGLQPTPELEQGLLSGPYHPAFGHLVNCRLKGEQLRMVARGHEGEDLRFLAPKNDLPLIFGDNRENLKQLVGNRKLAVSSSALPPGTVAAAPYPKKEKARPFAVLSEGDFLKKYLEAQRRAFCI